jgi:hypothetical protein
VRLPFLIPALCLAISSAPALLAQAHASPGCELQKGYYHCNQAAFVAALKEAKTVAVESKPFDQATTNSLGKLARELKKTEISDNADLTFVLIRTQAAGINYGPSDRELASFLVYSRGPRGAGRQLIWIETFDGEPDMAWPIVVFDIIRQFKASIR